MTGIFLGTGASNGVPLLTCECEVCTSSSSKNKRLRSSFFINYNDINLLIDTGPDLRQQLLRENIKKLDLVLYTHEHFDHIMGLDDLKLYTREKPINIYSSAITMNHIKKCFAHNFLTNEITMSGKVSLNYSCIKVYEAFYFKTLKIMPLALTHGNLISFGYKINKFAYLTDLKAIPALSYSYLEGLDVLVIDALRVKSHKNHLNFEEALREVKKIKPGITYFTHLSHDIIHGQYEYLEKHDVYLAYDGLRIEI